MTNMNNQILELWTWQSRDRDITSDQERDFSQVSSAWGEELGAIFRDAYDKLDEHLGTSNYVWCFDHYTNWEQRDRRKLWNFTLDADAVLEFVKSDMWDIIIKQKSSEISEDEAWGKLFVPPGYALAHIGKRNSMVPSKITPLVSVPIPKDSVIDSSRFNLPCNGGGRGDTPYSKLPTTLDLQYG